VPSLAVVVVFVGGSVDVAVEEEEDGCVSMYRRKAFTWVSIKFSRSGSSVYGYKSVI
jgi:hypothetical protein